MMHAIYSDDATVADLTGQLTSTGVRLFSFFRLGATDMDHVAGVLDRMAPRKGARMLDAGCGVGEFARLAAVQRPDVEFTLLNSSESQLAQCPAQMRKVAADFSAMPFPDSSFDAILVDHAIGSCDLRKAMAEFARVLRKGGVLFIHDVFRGDSGAEAFCSVLGNAQSVNDTLAEASRHGLVLSHSWDSVCSAPLPPETLDPVKPLLREVEAKALRFVNAGVDVHSAVSRHERVAVQFSGGKDSTAALYLLRPWWDRVAVYWVNTGDTVPETAAVVDALRSSLGNFIEVKTDSLAWRAENGDPSDIVTAADHAIGNALGFGTVRMSSRFDCCYANLMRPLHDRMARDRVSLVVRGTKDADMPAQPINSGDVYDAVEYLYPVQGWSDEDVMSFLEQESAPVADYYEYGVPNGSDCLSCTAWWDDRKSAFLRARYPEHFARYCATLTGVKTRLERHTANLMQEIGVDHGV